MHFVAVKTEAQQAQAMLFTRVTCWCGSAHRRSTRSGVTSPSTASLLRRAGPGIRQLAGTLEDGNCGLPEAVVELGRLLLGRIGELDDKIDGLDRKLRASAREVEETARLMTIPESDRSPRWHCKPSHRRWRASGAGATSRLGSASCRGSTRPAANRGWAGYRRWVSET